MAGVRVNLGLLKAEVGDMLVREDLTYVVFGNLDRVFHVHDLVSTLNVAISACTSARSTRARSRASFFVPSAPRFDPPRHGTGEILGRRAAAQIAGAHFVFIQHAIDRRA